VRRVVDLKENRTYRVSWRARMLRPWREGVAMRGKGRYSIGFRIPPDVLNAMPPFQRQEARPRVVVGMDPPPDREWREFSQDIKTEPLMTLLILRASDGEGDFLIDDIQIREILPPEPEPAEPD